MDTQGVGRGTRSGGNGLAAAAAVLGGTALVTSVVAVGGVLGAVGLVLSLLALRTSGRGGAGRSQAVIGVVTSSLAVVVSVTVVICAVWFAHRTQSCYHYNKIQPWTQCVQRQFDRL